MNEDSANCWDDPGKQWSYASDEYPYTKFSWTCSPREMDLSTEYDQEYDFNVSDAWG